MEALLENLIHEIKQDQRYLNFIESEDKLQSKEVLTLLQEYHDLYEQYQDIKQYEPYISSDEIKEKWLTAKRRLSKDPTIQQYYQSYYELNELLEHITSIIFKDISDDIIITK